jgi:potassium/hydrogen antiporter
VAAEDAIGALALLLAAGIVARLLASLARIPAVVVLLGAGALLGPHALGWLDVPLESTGMQVLLTLGVSFILFHGGLQLSLGVLRGTAVGLGLLVVPGVVLTAAVVGSVAAWAFDLPLLAGLLIGAALAPTDPAILIPLFDRLRLRRRVAQTIVAESALNDPTGAVLALAVAAALLGQNESLSAPALEFVGDVSISTAIGLLFGAALSLALSTGRIGVLRESAALGVIAVVAASFVSIDFAGGSGYVGPFLAGLIVGNMPRLHLRMHAQHLHEVRALVGGTADIVALLVFVALGANIPFAEVGEHLHHSLLVVGVLILVARPLTVAVCLLPDRRARWTRKELLFLAWTRETGVVPAALAALLVAEGVPHAELVVVNVAVALVVTVLLQSTTKAWLARRLGLLDER